MIETDGWWFVTAIKVPHLTARTERRLSVSPPASATGSIMTVEAACLLAQSGVPGTSRGSSSPTGTEEIPTHSPTAHASPGSASRPRNPRVTTPVSAETRTLLERLQGCLALNAVQRVLSAAVLAPLVTVFLWQSPAFATATVCSLIQSLCSYEFAWLAHRIQNRLLRALRRVDALRYRGSSVSQRGFTHESEEDDQDEEEPLPILQSAVSRGSFSMSNGGSVHIVQPQPLSLDDSQITSQQQPPVDATASTASPTPSLLRRVDPNDTGISGVDGSLCAVGPLAKRLAARFPWEKSTPLLYEWLVALVVAIVASGVAAIGFLYCVVPWIPELETTEFYESRVFYALATNLIAALCACFAPNWHYAVIVFVENAVFTVLTMYSTVCPINQFSCTLKLEPMHVLLAGIGLLLLLRFTTSHSSAEAFVLFLLDALGFLYIIGTLSVLVAFVDDDKRALYRKLLIVLLYVTWASDTGAYVTGKLLALFKYPFYHPLAAHLSKNKDYEGTLGAVIWGLAAMFLASDLLEVGGSFWSKTMFTIFGVVVGRFGDLFESLLKRAAGVKDSGSLIPGHGGVLDRIDALMFVTLVFARYYTMVLTAG